MRIHKMARGQSAVELALGLPFLVLLLFVVCEFARVFYMAMGVASAARAGVQYGAQSCTEPKVFVEVTTNATFRTGLVWGLPNTIPLKSTAVLQAQSGEGF